MCSAEKHLLMRFTPRPAVAQLMQPRATGSRDPPVEELSACHTYIHACGGQTWQRVVVVTVMLELLRLPMSCRYGFNPGSAASITGPHTAAIVGRTAVATTLAAGTGGLSAMVLFYAFHRWVCMIGRPVRIRRLGVNLCAARGDGSSNVRLLRQDACT
jgi:hypothetical protein